MTRREEAVDALAEACKAFAIMPLALVGYKAPMFPDFPMTVDLVDEVRACLRQKTRK